MPQWARAKYLRPLGAPDFFDDAGGDHHIFAKVLDVDGTPITRDNLIRFWSDGFDKLGDPAYRGYAAMSPKRISGWANQPIFNSFSPERGEHGAWCWCPQGASDVVVGGGLPNNRHISFFAVWQAQPAGTRDEPSSPVDHETQTPPAALLDELRNRVGGNWTAAGRASPPSPATRAGTTSARRSPARWRRALIASRALPKVSSMPRSLPRRRVPNQPHGMVNGMAKERAVHKYGFHVNRTGDDVFDAIARIRPRVIKTLAHDVGFWRRVREIQPDVFLIGRLYAPAAEQERFVDNPSAAGRAFAERILRLEANQADFEGRPLFDAWESYNEIFPEAVEPERKRAYDDFQVAFAGPIQAAGLQPVAMNFATGNMLGPDFVDYFPGTLATYRYLGFHEYDWPTLWRLHEENILTKHEGGMWLALRYRRVMEAVRQAYGDRHIVLITECGMTQGVQGGDDVGPWDTARPVSEQSYWDSLMWYNGELVRDHYVMAACLFVVGAVTPWQSFEHLGGIVDRLELLQAGAAPQVLSAPALPVAPVAQPAPQPHSPRREEGEKEKQMRVRTCRVGIHGRNDRFFSQDDLRVIQDSRMEVVKMMSLTDPSVFAAIKALNPDIEIITRLHDDRIGHGHPTPAEFAEKMVPIMAALQPYCAKFQIANEPNHVQRYEGWGPDDADAADFNQWFLEVYRLLKEACPWASLGFPGLAIPDFAHRDRAWLQICRPAIERADWLGVHCYWQTPPDRPSVMMDENFGLTFKYYHAQFPDKTLEILECGNSNGQNPQWPISEDDIAREYVTWLQEVFNYPYINSASFFLLSSPDRANWEFFAWRTENNFVKPVARAVAAMNRPPRQAVPTTGAPAPLPAPPPPPSPAPSPAPTDNAYTDARAGADHAAVSARPLHQQPDHRRLLRRRSQTRPGRLGADGEGRHLAGRTGPGAHRRLSRRAGRADRRAERGGKAGGPSRTSGLCWGRQLWAARRRQAIRLVVATPRAGYGALRHAPRPARDRSRRCECARASPGRGLERVWLAPAALVHGDRGRPGPGDGCAGDATRPAHTARRPPSAHPL